VPEPPRRGGLFRGAWDPVLIASQTPPDRVDKAAVKNWLIADYEIPRAHPYSKPPEVIEYVLRRVCRRGDRVLDPFAGSSTSCTAAGNLKLDIDWRAATLTPSTQIWPGGARRVMAELGSPGVDRLGAVGERLAVNVAELAALSAAADGYMSTTRR
jgi:hypothetical protein